MCIILYFVITLGVLALGGWAIHGICIQYIKSADDRVKRFEEQLKDKRK